MEDDWAEDDLANYRGTEYIGKLGVEQSYESELHGQTGFEEVEMSAGGHAGAAPEEPPGDAWQRHRPVDRHPPAGAGRAAVRRPARRARRHRPAQRRDPRLRQQAQLRPEPVRRRHRRRELARPERIARQAAAQPGVARHLSARLDLQAVHGAGGAHARQAHAAAGDLRSRLLQLRQPPLPRRQGRRPRRRRHVQVDRPFVRHLLLRSRQRDGRRRHARLHGAAGLRPADRNRPARRGARHAAVDRMEAQGLQEEGSAEVVRRRDDLARHRPGLQHVHHAAARAGPGDRGGRRPALHAASGARGRELRDARIAPAELSRRSRRSRGSRSTSPSSTTPITA